MERLIYPKENRIAGCNLLNKRRICTTVSQKHWELLNKYSEKYETQQKALEKALECLENSSKQSQTLTQEEKWEEKYWTLIKATKTACYIQKDGLKILLETANIELFKDYVTQHKPVEYAIEYYLQKPLKELSLQEVINGLVIIAKMSNLFDTADFTEEEGHYKIIITHSLGINNSKFNLMTFESVFKTYGVKVESTISEKMIFMKIFKN